MTAFGVTVVSTEMDHMPTICTCSRQITTLSHCLFSDWKVIQLAQKPEPEGPGSSAVKQPLIR